jgi:uncharacterized iron-regulated protein
MAKAMGWLTLALWATMLAQPVFACETPPPEPKFQARQGWQSGPTTHPLLGKIIGAAKPDCSMGLMQAVALLQNKLAAGGFVLLGEIHDNGEHHWLRALLIEGIVFTQPPGPPVQPGLVFEHLRADQQGALDAFQKSYDRTRSAAPVDAFFSAVDWNNSGWPDAQLYAPLFKTALHTGWPIRVGDPARATVRAVARGGLAAFGNGEAALLHLDKPLPDALQDTLLSELEGSHCGLMPKSAFGTMAVAQRYRDAYLAMQLIAAANQQGSAILLAGNGHVRSDRGVPYYLKQMTAEPAALSVVLVEVEPGKNEPSAYMPRDPKGSPAADLIIFTPRAEREDPCVAMRAQFGKKG